MANPPNPPPGLGGFTREQWARDFLTALGNPNPSQDTVDWVIGWTVHETSTGGGATYNLLNTTEQASGSTFFNYLNPQHTFGVQNYPTYAEGIQENAHVLGENFGGYSDLKAALLANDIGALSGPSGGVRQGLRTWCGGCGYGIDFLQSGSAHRADLFTYGSATPIKPLGNLSSTDPCAFLLDTKKYPNGDYNGCKFCVDNVINHPDLAKQTGASLADCLSQFSGHGNATPGFPGVTDTTCAPWDITCIAGALAPAAKIVGLFVLGVFLVCIGIYLLFREQINGAVAKTASVAKVAAMV